MQCWDQTSKHRTLWSRDRHIESPTRCLLHYHASKLHLGLHWIKFFFCLLKLGRRRWNWHRKLQKGRNFYFKIFIILLTCPFVQKLYPMTCYLSWFWNDGSWLYWPLYKSYSTQSQILSHYSLHPLSLSLRSRRDRSRAQSFGLVRSLLATKLRERRLRRQNYGCKYNSASYVATQATCHFNPLLKSTICHVILLHADRRKLISQLEWNHIHSVMNM